MEIKISTKQILNLLYVISWIIFVGVCIDAGGIISNSFYAMVLNPAGAQNFWQGVDLSDLYRYDAGHFLKQTMLMGIPAIMKAILFYLIIKILHDKRLDMAQPFNKEMGRFIFNISYLSLGIGLFSGWGVKNTEWLVKEGVKMPQIQYLHLSGADVWLFMSVVLFVIAQIFKRGIEIQSEHELTV